MGFMVGVQLTGEAPPYVTALREAALLAPMAGGNVIRLLPPLNATTEELARSVEIFRAVLKAKA
jgi:acetylornithine aminotransferase/acetylornithine/N-succinyldiaminopimelate aminotransferase